MLGHGKGEQHIAHFGVGRPAPGHDLKICGGDPRRVARLDEEAAGHGFEGLPRGRRVGQGAHDEQAQVLLGRKKGDGFIVSFWRYDYFGEDLDHLGCGRRVEPPVDRDNAAKGADRIALQGAQIGFGKASAQGHAAGIGMLDDRHGGAGLGVELGHQLHRSVGVVDIVVA